MPAKSTKITKSAKAKPASKASSSSRASGSAKSASSSKAATPAKATKSAGSTAKTSKSKSTNSAAKATKTTKAAKTTAKATKAAPKPAKSGAKATKATKPAQTAAKATKAPAAKSPAKSAKAASATKAPTKSGKSSTARTSAAKSTKASAKAKKSNSRQSAAQVDPLDAVKPLIRVRQMREFSGKRVTREELEAIAEVARWSGSSRNEQSCRFIALRHRATIEKLAELGLPQTRGLPTATAAIAIVEPDEPERGITRAFDDGRAAERILIAAYLLGLAGGISRIRSDVRDPINELLGLPANRSVRTIVALGHPTADALAPKSARGKARLPREEVVYEEGWPIGE